MKFSGEHIFCIVTGASGGTLHHLYTQKARPDLIETEWNLLPVCQKIHNEIHAKGLLWTAQKYPEIAEWLEQNNWSFDHILMRWNHS